MIPGMGLERLACIVQDVDSMFDIDTMKALRRPCVPSGGCSVWRMSGNRYVITCYYRSYSFCDLYDFRWYPAFQQWTWIRASKILAEHAAMEVFLGIERSSSW